MIIALLLYYPLTYPIASHDISSYPIFHLFRFAMSSRLPNGRRHLRVVRDVSQDTAAGDHGGGSKGGREAEDRCQITAGVEVPRTKDV